MMRFLENCRVKGYSVMGTSLDDGALPLSQTKVKGPTVLVLGNEGFGLRTNVRRACDTMVMIEGVRKTGGGADAGVDSLNVSVTGGVLMHFLQQGSREQGELVEDAPMITAAAGAVEGGGEGGEGGGEAQPQEG